MPKVRRTEYAFFYVDDRDYPDVTALLRGELKAAPLRRIVAASILAGEEHAISAAALDVLLCIPTDRWVDAEDVDHGDVSVTQLARLGLLVTDEPGAAATAYRRRDEQLASGQWHVYAALYHFMTKWRDVDDAPDDLDTPSADDAPPVFHSVAHEPADVVRLPDGARNGSLYDLLERRRTSRVFDAGATISSVELGTILRHTFGCQSYVAAGGNAVVLRKTSPSGGSLHPTEVYPVIRAVDGIAPGLYHYSVASHALEPIRRMRAAEVASLCDEFTAGQAFARDAQALFVLSTRFFRSFWKYRRHSRAYAVLLMDAGHLSQTFYLVCTELGLGAFVTTAINGANVEDALGLDAYAEGVLAICGCGVTIAS